MKLAQVSSERSKDPNTQVGAVLVNEEKRIIGIGYNGMPKGNDSFPWNRNGPPEKTKYSYVIHAELNALLNTVVRPKDFSLYVTLFPCANCSKILIQAGLKQVFFHDEKYLGTDDDKISKAMLKASEIPFQKI